MSMRQLIICTLIIIGGVGAVFYLTQAVEPTRETAVEVLEYDKLVR